jgi:hypothetical protein
LKPFLKKGRELSKMTTFRACCPDLENLMYKPAGENGLGLAVMVNKRGARFILEYRKDWAIAAAEATMLIRFCPYCGRELRLPSDAG